MLLLRSQGKAESLTKLIYTVDDWTLLDSYRREDTDTEGGGNRFQISVHGCNRQILNIHSFCSTRLTSELCESKRYGSTV